VLGLYNDMWTFIEEEAKNFWALIASWLCFEYEAI
jgi:hypothetical protein